MLNIDNNKLLYVEFYNKISNEKPNSQNETKCDLSGFMPQTFYHINFN